MVIHPASWHEKRLKWCREQIEFADRRKTDDEQRAARLFLNYPPPYDELIPHEQTEIFL